MSKFTPEISTKIALNAAFEAMFVDLGSQARMIANIIHRDAMEGRETGEDTLSEARRLQEVIQHYWATEPSLGAEDVE